MPTTWAISPRRHASRYRVDGNSSPPPSESSSDEGEDQYKATRTRADHRQQTPEKLLNRKIARARKPTRAEAYRDDITSRSNSRFERRSTDRNERISPSEESGDVYITTMDEDDQQMFIALFYWRRKVIEAHFSAWKWVIFTLRRSERQTQRREINIRPSRPLSIGYESTELRPTRRNLILKRHTGPPSVEESEKTYSDVALEKRVQRKLPSISDTNSDRDISPGSNTEKRRQFREQLRVDVCNNSYKPLVSIAYNY
ncbi:hypothetical protein V7S43_004938 [Phytophthora oleae]|uniref:DDE Tnp4 domain-containing protein n=1 Tax=Phytophthora oleae TaxID=2107226 RepID=A0ABD3FV59_9STRA